MTTALYVDNQFQATCDNVSKCHHGSDPISIRSDRVGYHSINIRIPSGKLNVSIRSGGYAYGYIRFDPKISSYIRIPDKESVKE
ncbi:unnamed protein product, partial [Allacma fusca]